VKFRKNNSGNFISRIGKDSRVSLLLVRQVRGCYSGASLGLGALGGSKGQGNIGLHGVGAPIRLSHADPFLLRSCRFLAGAAIGLCVRAGGRIRSIFLDAQELNLKNKRLARCDVIAGAFISVGKIRRNVELPF
jgi:hypothetical protein